MVIYRVGQGVGAALMFSNSTPIITDLFIGPDLALYIGINQIALASGFVLGPVVCAYPISCIKDAR
jgi:MFS family permease